MKPSRKSTEKQYAVVQEVREQKHDDIPDEVVIRWFMRTGIIFFFCFFIWAAVIAILPHCG